MLRRCLVRWVLSGPSLVFVIFAWGIRLRWGVRKPDRLLVKEGDMVKTPQAIAILDSRDRRSGRPRPSSRTSARRRSKPSKSESRSQKRRNPSPESHHGPHQGRSQPAIVARLEIDRSTSIAAQQATIARIRAQQQGEIQTQQATIARLQAELRNATSEDRGYWQL